MALLDDDPSSNSSSYLALLTSLASDLDCMLNELCTPEDWNVGKTKFRANSFLEPYMQEISSQQTSPCLSNDAALINSPNQNSVFTNGNPVSNISNGFHEPCQTNHSNDEDSQKITSTDEKKVITAQTKHVLSKNERNLNFLLNKPQQQPFTVSRGVSTGRSGHFVHRGTQASSDEENREANNNLHRSSSEDTLSQKEDDGLSSCEDVASENSDCDTPCGISLMERLIRSHPVWFLPGIQRAGAVHLLQGKEEGNFVVRQSSQPDTMAISVRLPVGKGPYIEHYLIQAFNNVLSLESSENTFDSIPKFIAHYSLCCDELPVQLTLPRTIKEAKTRQQLTSFALLGQEFWRYPMAYPRSSISTHFSIVSPTNSLSSVKGNEQPDVGLASSRTKDEIILDLVPLHSPNFSTFKSDDERQRKSETRQKPIRPNTLNLRSINTSSENNKPLSSIFNKGTEGSQDLILPVKSPPPLHAKTPPPPPPRWAKPTTSSQQVSITTTVTFSVNEMPNRSFQMSPQIPQQSGESDMEPSSMSLPLSSPCSDASSLPCPSISSPNSEQAHLTSRLHNLVSPISDTTNFVSKSFQKIENVRSLVSTPTEKPHRNTKRHHRRIKESQHYKEFDILETPTDYYKSQLVDKQSDYEDVWAANESFKTFKRPPDLIEKLSGNSPETPATAGSPFYAEPADSLKPEVVKRTSPVSKNSANVSRHSDPAHFARWPGSGVASNSEIINALPRIESRPELPDSISADNILQMRFLVGKLSSNKNRSIRGKAVQPPKVTNNSKTERSWTVDSSWEFIGQEEGKVHRRAYNEKAKADQGGHPFPSLEQQMDAESPKATVHHIIAQRFPHLLLEPTVSLSNQSLSLNNTSGLSRVSAYDNLQEIRRLKGEVDAAREEDAETIFSEPWDSARWEDLLRCDSESTIKVGGEPILDTEDDETILETPKKPRHLARTKSFRERLDPLLSPPRLQSLRNRELLGTGSSIRSYALQLAADKTTTFAQNVENFIACTLEAKETNPQIVMRNMRQFMSGMKNYLVKHGEKEFIKHVEYERMKLKSTEFLNLDAILEGVMHKLVVRPLRKHLYKLFVDEYTRSGAIQKLHENIVYARTKNLMDLGVKARILPPDEEALKQICGFISNLQEVDSPLEKLENLLACIATIFNSVKSSSTSKSSVLLGADDFLPLFVWVLVQSGFLAAEIEAEYMWGLLHPSLLSGEGGYYLTTLSSAVHVLKTFKSTDSNISTNKSNNQDGQSVLKVVVPDESQGSILTTTLPVRPHMTTRDVTKIIAHKVRITNPQDYGLFQLVDGEETLLGDSDCPQEVKQKVISTGKHCMLAYKRIDAKIAWPNT